MRINRFGAALTAAALSLTLIVPASAAPASASREEAVRVVSALNIMVGDEHGDMRLEEPVTRAQFTTMAVKATPGGDQIGAASVSPYPDVPRQHWSAGYVKAAVDLGLISGFTDGTFRPDRTITLAEGATIVLKLLGYQSADFSGSYPSGQMQLCRSLKLDQGVAARSETAPLTRSDAMYLFYNLMTAPTKAGVPYLTQLGHALTPSGEIDLVSLINEKLEGPLLVQEGWEQALPFDLTSAVFYRDGSAVSPAQIRPLDVAYYHPDMRSVWFYDRQVTGTIQAVSPGTSRPASVTVAGRTCPIETSAAAYALSDLGSFRVGDTVTLLLGREGGAAFVLEPDALTGRETVGLVTAVSDQSFPDGQGGTYQQRTASLLATDGRTYQYPCDKNIKPEDLVQVVSDRDGLTLKKLSSASLSGSFSSDGGKLGSYALAPDAEILDVSGAAGLSVPASRLAGVRLEEEDVRYFRLNGQEEIDRLILKDVTGDLWQYGVLSEKTSVGAGIHTYYAYDLTVGSAPVIIPQSTTGFPVQEGPIALRGPLQAPEKMKQLISAGEGSVSGNRFSSGARSHTLADGVLVYEKKDGDYRLSSLARAREQGLTLTGWYDRTDREGGRIRVILAA